MHKKVMEITFLIIENHGIVFFNFCGNPDIYFTPGRIFIKRWLNVDLSETVCRIYDSAPQIQCQDPIQTSFTLEFRVHSKNNLKKQNNKKKKKKKTNKRILQRYREPTI